MAKLINRVESRFFSIAENVALSRVMVAAVAAPLDLLLSQLDEIKGAVSEAVSNAIIHGYEGRADELVGLAIEHWEDRLTIRIKDNGVGIQNIAEAMEPNFSSCGDRMGLGFAFMNSFMDKLEVFSEIGKGTEVILTKMLQEETTESNKG